MPAPNPATCPAIPNPELIVEPKPGIRLAPILALIRSLTVTEPDPVHILGARID
jgi:hypothetical protein